MIIHTGCANYHKVNKYAYTVINVKFAFCLLSMVCQLTLARPHLASNINTRQGVLVPTRIARWQQKISSTLCQARADRPLSSALPENKIPGFEGKQYYRDGNDISNIQYQARRYQYATENPDDGERMGPVANTVSQERR